MKLLTKALLNKFASVGDQSEVEDPLIICKFFHPFHPWRRYASEYDPDTKIFFGFVDGDFPEWWYFSLDELEQVKIMGLGMERDMFFDPRRFSELNLKN